MGEKGVRDKIALPVSWKQYKVLLTTGALNMPDGPSKTVHNAFHQLREFLHEANTDVPGLDTVEEAMANLEPLDREQKRVWDTVVYTVSHYAADERSRMRAQAYRLKEEFGRLIGPLKTNLPSLLPWYLHRPATQRRLVIAAGLRGVPSPIVIDLDVSNRGLAVESSETVPDGGDTTIHTFKYKPLRVHVTLLRQQHGQDEEMPGVEYSGNSHPTIPQFFIDDPEFTADSGEETVLALRSVMEKLGLYQTRAIYTRNIHIYNRPDEIGPSEAVFSGYVVNDLPSEWVRLFEVPPLLGTKYRMKGMLDSGELPTLRKKRRQTFKLYSTFSRKPASR